MGLEIDYLIANINLWNLQTLKTIRDLDLYRMRLPSHLPDDKMVCLNPLYSSLLKSYLKLL